MWEQVELMKQAALAAQSAGVAPVAPPVPSHVLAALGIPAQPDQMSQE
jgi:hypothetical protein